VICVWCAVGFGVLGLAMHTYLLSFSAGVSLFLYLSAILSHSLFIFLSLSLSLSLFFPQVISSHAHIL